jgi:hypothetical protein
LIRLRYRKGRGRKKNDIGEKIIELVEDNDNNNVWIIFVEIPDASYRDKLVTNLKTVDNFLKNFNVLMILHTPEEKITDFVEYVKNG